MNNYCRRNPDDCGIITDDGARSFKKRLIPRTLLPLLKRQDTPSVLASDIIIISIVDTSNGLQVTFFVRIMSGVISAQAIADAVQEAIDDGVYSTAGFTVTDVTIVDPPPTPDDDDDDDGLSGGQIAGIVIGVVVGVPLFLVILSLLAYCLGRQKNSKQRSASIPQTDDELAMRKVPKDPFSREAQGSVHSVKMTFVGVQDSDDEEEDKRYN